MVVCCSGHPLRIFLPAAKLAAGNTPALPPFILAGAPIREKSRCAVLPQNPRIDFLQTQPKGIDRYLARFHVKHKKKTKMGKWKTKGKSTKSTSLSVTCSQLSRFGTRTTKQSFPAEEPVAIQHSACLRGRPESHVNSTGRYSCGHLPACVLRPRDCYRKARSAGAPDDRNAGRPRGKVPVASQRTGVASSRQTRS